MGTNEEIRTSWNNVKTGKDSVVNIGDKFGLDENAVKELLEKLREELSNKISQNGEKVTDEVAQKISILVESKYIETVCNLSEGQQSSEKEIIRAVQQNFRALQNSVTNIVNTIKAELDGLREMQSGVKPLSESLDELKVQYMHQANMPSKILEILEPIKDAADREKQTAKIELYSAWESLREAQFDHAQNLFRQVIDRNYNVADAYFGLALADCKIQLIWDYTQNREQPICFDHSINFSENQYYKNALQFSSDNQKEEYKNLAKDIAEILKYFREFRNLEGNKDFNTAFECFICIKVTDKDGKKTDDCKWIDDNNIYEALNKEVRTFYSEIDCDKYTEKGTLKYGALIMYALSRAKCLLLVCSKEEYLQTPWVKNEYTRFCNFLKLRNQDAGKQIIMVIDGQEIELPNGLRSKGYQDIDRAKSENLVTHLVNTVKSRVNEGKGYVERYWKYCPKCGGQFPSDYDTCPIRGCNNVKLFDTHSYLNEELRKEREKAQREKDEYKRCIDELKKKGEEVEKALKEAKARLKKQTVVNSAKIIEATGINYDRTQFEIEGAVLIKCLSSQAEVKIPDGVRVIVKGAFNNCSSLKSIAIPESVTRIGDSTFSGCSSLTSITIPESVISIGNSAFSGCSSLTSITIPESVISIGNSAFSGCSSLTSINYTGNIADWCGVSGLSNLMSSGRKLYIDGKELAGELIIPEGVIKISSYAFYRCNLLTKVTIPESVKSIGDSAFSSCSSLTSITIPKSVTRIGDSAFSSCSSLTSITIPKSVKSIGSFTFYVCSLLTSIVIPHGVKSIGSYAFSNCSSLTDVTIPESVISIGDSAFSSCSSLTSITIPKSVTRIGDSAFSSCSSLTSITIPKSVKSIGSFTFYVCSLLTSIVIPHGVKSIGSYAFSNCSSLTSVTLSGSVKNIYEGAFDTWRSGLTRINYTGNIADWCEISGLSNLMSPGRKLYIDGKELEGELIIPEGVIKISSYAFYCCNLLTKVTIPESVKSIGSYAFNYCNSLTSIIIPNAVERISKGAFDGCNSLISVTIPDSLTRIGEYLFNNCSRMQCVSISKYVTKIARYAFGGCSSLKSINFQGTMKEWALIDRDDYWKYGANNLIIIQCSDGNVRS